MRHDAAQIVRTSSVRTTHSVRYCVTFSPCSEGEEEEEEEEEMSGGRSLQRRRVLPFFGKGKFVGGRKDYLALEKGELDHSF